MTTVAPSPRRCRGPLPLALVLLGALLPRALARDPEDEDGPVQRRVAVVVTAVSGGSIYLDRGRDDHIEPGDTLELRPAGGSLVFGVVRSTSRSGSRAEVPSDSPPISPGDRGEVLVPETRFEEAQAQAEEVALPPPKPWTSTEADFDTDQPLLAPAFSRPPDEKPARVYGRVFFLFNANEDLENDNGFQLWRTGVDVRVENPFGQGGEARVDGEFYRRSYDLGNGGDDETTDGRLDLAYYTWGGTREQPDRWQVGRFLQNRFPELGWLDGVQYTHRTDTGSQWGGSLGAMPEPYTDRDTDDDLQAAVYYYTDSGGELPVDFGVAYQNTWHRGEQDRNLLVLTADSSVIEDIDLHASALVDYYGPGDSIKDDGLELTEAHLDANWLVSRDGGLGLHATHLRWPELKRNEFDDLDAEQVAGNRLTRVSLDGWYRPLDVLRLDARVARWQDQDDDGGSGSLRASLQDVLWDRGEVSAEVFFTNGTFTDGQGLQLAASRWFETVGTVNLSWTTTHFDQDVIIGDGDVDQQTLRASLDSDLGDGWSFSLYAERRTGDDIDSYNLGLFLQQRF